MLHADMVFCSFPLHTPNKPSRRRAEQIDQITVPMLFLSGARDGMTEQALMEELAMHAGATLHWPRQSRISRTMARI